MKTGKYSRWEAKWSSISPTAVQKEKQFNLVIEHRAVKDLCSGPNIAQWVGVVKREEVKSALYPDNPGRTEKQRGSQSLRLKKEERSKWILVSLKWKPDEWNLQTPRLEDSGEFGQRYFAQASVRNWLKTLFCMGVLLKHLTHYSVFLNR